MTIIPKGNKTKLIKQYGLFLLCHSIAVADDCAPEVRVVYIYSIIYFIKIVINYFREITRYLKWLELALNYPKTTSSDKFRRSNMGHDPLSKFKKQLDICLKFVIKIRRHVLIHWDIGNIPVSSLWPSVLSPLHMRGAKVLWRISEKQKKKIHLYFLNILITFLFGFNFQLNFWTIIKGHQKCLRYLPLTISKKKWHSTRLKICFDNLYFLL